MSATWEASFFFCVCVAASCSMTEKAVAPHSSTLAWKIPWIEEPGGLQSMGWLRVGHDWVTSLSFFTFMHWRRKWQPTPVFLPGESQGRGSLLGCRLWGRTESDTTEVTEHSIACSMKDLSSLTRDWTYTPCSRSPLDHWRSPRMRLVALEFWFLLIFVIIIATWFLA